jgi:hypothetical protein
MCCPASTRTGRATHGWSYYCGRASRQNVKSPPFCYGSDAPFHPAVCQNLYTGYSGSFKFFYGGG